MREILINWIAQIAQTLKLKKETMFLTCYFIDFYLNES